MAVAQIRCPIAELPGFVLLEIIDIATDRSGEGRGERGAEAGGVARTSIAATAWTTLCPAR